MNGCYPAIQRKQSQNILAAPSTSFPGSLCHQCARTQRRMWVEFVIGSRPCSEGIFPHFFGFQRPSININSSRLWERDSEDLDEIKRTSLQKYPFALYFNLCLVYSGGMLLKSRVTTVSRDFLIWATTRSLSVDLVSASSL